MGLNPILEPRDLELQLAAGFLQFVSWVIHDIFGGLSLFDGISVQLRYYIGVFVLHLRPTFETHP